MLGFFKKEEFLTDKNGVQVPKSKIKPLDLERHGVVMEIVCGLASAKAELKKAEDKNSELMDAFCHKMADRYGAAIGGIKGNITLYSFDGKYKVQKRIADKIIFTEQLHAAKALIDECIVEWSKNAGDELRLLVADAFNVDKQGRLNLRRILDLRRLNIDNPKWKQAMNAINDSLHVVESKEYIRLYERRCDGSYEHIA